MSYFVTLVFPSYQPPLTVKHHESEVYVAYSENKTTTMEPLVDWRSTLIKKNIKSAQMFTTRSLGPIR